MSSEAEPVHYLESDRDREPGVGVGLCFSGGGYRAMLFHLGSLLRLCEIGYLGSQSIPASLGKLERVSSVSGGSITAAVCAQAWHSIRPAEAGCRERFFGHVVGPVRKLAGKTIDVGSVLTGALPFTSIADRVTAAIASTCFATAPWMRFPSTPAS